MVFNSEDISQLGCWLNPRLFLYMRLWWTLSWEMKRRAAEMHVDRKVSLITSLIIYYLIDKLNQTIHWCGNWPGPSLHILCTCYIVKGGLNLI